MVVKWLENLFGRQKIYTDVVVDENNAVEVLSKAISTHIKNQGEIDYLFNYYKGKQPILQRNKDIRPEICNKIVINRANEIVSFKDGYLIGEPVQYISNGGNDSKNDELNTLNAYMNTAGKRVGDIRLVNWMHICGIGYRLVLPNKDDIDKPFNLYTLDPRNTFVIYLNDVAKTPQMGVTYVQREDKTIIFTCYTKNKSFTITGDSITGLPGTNYVVSKVEKYISPLIPIVEYEANVERMGAFETVLSLLDAINLTESNRLDGVEQFIQSILCFLGVQITREQLTELLDLGAINLPADTTGGKADVKYLVQELNQQQTQVLVDNMYECVLTICGMPNRNGGSSTSDTGSAVIMRDGWSNAEGRAKFTEGMFDEADKNMLILVLNILRLNTSLELKLSDIKAKFTRRNYENLTVKVNALVAMLNNGKVHPLDAFQASGLFIDSEAAYTRGKEYYEKNKAVVTNMEVNADANNTNTNTSTGENNTDTE